MSDFFDNYNEKIRDLSRRFSGYSPPVDPESIRSWIRQFDETDWELSIKILDFVDYYTNYRICTELRDLYEIIQLIPGFNIMNTYFAAFSGAGHSGDIIIERFRFANRLKSERLDNLFIHLTDLNREEIRESPNAKYIFLEDFVGTGNSTFKKWDKITLVLPDSQELYLAIICGYSVGIQKIEDELPIEVISGRILYDDRRFFSELNTYFSEPEKENIKKYCEDAGSMPFGYKNCQSNVLFYTRAPNDIISILRCNTQWKGLFKRN